MTIMPLSTRFILTTGLVVALSACALLPFGSGPDAQREVVVRVRNMAYYVENDSKASNPLITVTAGERIRIRLVSEDRGFSHDFAIKDWNVGTQLVRGEENTSVVIQVPENPGRFTYICTLHAAMMKGTIEVVPAEAANVSGD
jgi:plastocyanin